MKPLLLILWIPIMMGVTLLPLGCDRKEKMGDGHEEASPSGASFKHGKGITLKEETSKIIGLEIVDVSEEMLPQVVQFKVQIFGQAHHFNDRDTDHTGCQFHGSGFLPSERAELVQAKQRVRFKNSQGEMLDGFVVAVQKPLTQGEAEVIVGLTTVESKLKEGEFVGAEISVPRDAPVIVIPQSALLRTVMGTYVYAVNGDAYYRTAVTVGSSTDKKIEIIDGLYAGDQVVAKPVETLWIIELRATKGGGHSH